MRDFPNIAKWGLGAAGGLLLLLGLLLFTSPGLAIVGSLVRLLTGGDVTVEGLSGSSPNALQAELVVISDPQGPWLRIEKASLRWSALAALGNHIAIRDVTAARVVLLRRPAPSARESKPTLFEIDRLSLPNVEIRPAVIGRPVTLGASGALHYLTLRQFAADLVISRRNRSDLYRIAGGIERDIARGNITIREGEDGILAELMELPGLGPINLAARASGTRAANALSFSLSAGPLRAEGRGTIALATRRADLEFSASAPPMALRPDMGWQSLTANGAYHGSFDAPAIRAHLALAQAKFAGIGAKQLTADVTGEGGRVGLTGSAADVSLPGSHPDIFARAPLTIEASANLNAPNWPVTFHLRHLLTELSGDARASGPQLLHAQLTVPSLAPFAALQGIDLRGSATARLSLEQRGRQLRLGLNGTMDTRGATVVARLLGRAAILDFQAVVEGADIANSSIRLQGAALDTQIDGHFRRGVLNYRLALDMTDLSRLLPTLQGTLALRGSVNGPLERAAVSASGDARLATRGFARQKVAIDLKATGFPLGEGKLSLTGRLNGAPLALQAALTQGDARRAALTARWKSLNAKADIAMPENGGLRGQANLTLARLADIAVFSGSQIAGAAKGSATFRPNGARTNMAAQLSLTAARLDDIAAEHVAIDGTITDLFGKPGFGGDIAARGISAFGLGGDARLHVAGPPDRMAVSFLSGLKDAGKAPIALTAVGMIDMPQQNLSLSALNGSWRGVAVTLDAPVHVDFAQGGLALGHLAAHLGGGQVTASGRLLPQLALTADARDVPLASFQALVPPEGVQGVVSAHAALTGSFVAPQGLVTVEGRDLRAAFSSRSLPPATIVARALLHGDGASVTAALAAGTAMRLDLTGEAPLAAGRVIALHAGGTIDLSLLDPLVAAEGRRVRGTLTLDADIGGSMSAPRVTGTGKLAGGDVQDYALGARVQGIEAALEARGNRITVTSLTGRAGPGTITGSGSIDLEMPGMPVDFRFNARNARPMVSDLFTANLSGDVRLTGPLNALTAAGSLQISRGEINLPEKFPQDVAVLNVRRRGRPPPPPTPRHQVALDVAVRTSGPIFVRGHGVDAEMGGEIKVGGTIAAPLVSGDFRMNRGSYDFAGQTLNFTNGRISFDGTGLRKQLDPSLDFVAQTESGGVTAILQVGGYASAPKVTLSSTPQLPQDEVIAHLLFQQSVKQLSPLQLASMAQGIGALGGFGIGGGAGGFNPLGTLRRTVGLDRLSVGSVEGATPGQSQTTVEAGRYISPNVYVGVKQNLSGGTRTQVQVDLTRHLKAQATVSAGTDASATQGSSLQDNGSSVGLSYQFEY
jgi:translocation and assembly module TamB